MEINSQRTVSPDIFSHGMVQCVLGVSVHNSEAARKHAFVNLGIGGELKVVKQEMTRVNIDILGISELRWTGMGEFNSDDHYIYYCGQEYLRRNGVAIIVNKRLGNAVLGCNLKNSRDLCSFPRQAIQYHGNPSLCPNQ